MRDLIKNNLIYLALGIVIALAWNISNLAILFMLPLIGFSLLSSNRKAAAFLSVIGFMIIFLPINLIPNMIFYKDRSLMDDFQGHISNIYSLLLEDVTLPEDKSEDVDSNILFHKRQIIDDFDSSAEGYAVASGKEYNPQLFVSNFGKNNSSLKINFNTPIINDVTVQKRLDFHNWKDYLYLNFWINSIDDSGLFEVIIEDADGDYWHYFDERALKKRGWHKIRIDFKDLQNPAWTKQGNGKLNLENISYLYFNFNSYGYQDEKSTYSVYIDEISLES